MTWLGRMTLSTSLTQIVLARCIRARGGRWRIVLGLSIVLVITPTSKQRNWKPVYSGG
jgi:hypothetical protein